MRPHPERIFEGREVDMSVCKIGEFVTKDTFKLCVVGLAGESQAAL